MEKNINCTVPAYFKNILKACGYENAITIASIEEEDVQYFEEEVRNGKVSKYYEGMGAINILDGSTKTEANFEFTRGHKKFLIFISNFLKKYSKENASDSVKLPLKKTSEKKFKKMSNDLSPTCNIKLPNKKQKDFHDSNTNRDMNLHQDILTCKVIMSLIHTTPAMYATVRPKPLQSKINRLKCHFKFPTNFLEYGFH